MEFGTLQRDGTVTNKRTLTKEAVSTCPNTIFMPEHYGKGTEALKAEGIEAEACDCYNHKSLEMPAMGYTWNGTHWS